MVSVIPLIQVTHDIEDESDGTHEYDHNLTRTCILNCFSFCKEHDISMSDRIGV